MLTRLPESAGAFLRSRQSLVDSLRIGPTSLGSDSRRIASPLRAVVVANLTGCASAVTVKAANACVRSIAPPLQTEAQASVCKRTRARNPGAAKLCGAANRFEPEDAAAITVFLGRNEFRPKMARDLSRTFITKRNNGKTNRGASCCLTIRFCMV